MSKNPTPNLPPLPGGDDRREQARAARHAAVARQAEQDRRERRKQRLMRQVGLPALLAVLVLGTTVLVLVTRDDGDEPITVNDRPSLVDASGSLTYGSSDPEVVIEVVEDFQCPVCGQFEQAAGGLLADYRDDPRIQVRYRPIAFLDRASSTRYSSRAANAAACVAEAGAEEWLAFHGELFENQPPEGTAGLSDDRLLDLAEQAGVDKDRIEECVSDELYGDWVTATTAAAFEDDITGTPTVLVDGERLDGFDVETIRTAVEAALS